MIWGLEIPAWVALIGAVTAVIALAWNVRFSVRQQKFAALARHASIRLDWVEKLRSASAEFMALCETTNKLRSKSERDRGEQLPFKKSFIFLLLDPNNPKHQKLAIATDRMEEAVDQSPAAFKEHLQTFRDAAHDVIHSQFYFARREMKGEVVS